MLADRLISVRKKKRYKQKDVANCLGITPKYICDLEKGRSKPSELFIKAYCLKFNVNEEWLKTGQGDMLNEVKNEDEDILSKLKDMATLLRQGIITETELKLLKNKLLSPLKGTGTDA